jgi:hypothetical protein
MRDKAGLIAELEVRALAASTLAEGQRLSLEAERLRRPGGSWNWLNLRFAAALPRN